jgi:hypothetical protein
LLCLLPTSELEYFLSKKSTTAPDFRVAYARISSFASHTLQNRIFEFFGVFVGCLSFWFVALFGCLFSPQLI